MALLRCFGYVKCCGCAPILANRDTRRLILDGSLCPPPPAFALARAGQTSAGLVCACTHYLVFKEPAASPPISRRAPERLSVREPSNVTAAGHACQPPISRRPHLSAGAPAGYRRLGNLTRVSSAQLPVNTYLRVRALSSGLTRNRPAVCAATRVRGRRTEYPSARPLSNQSGATGSGRCRGRLAAALPRRNSTSPADLSGRRHTRGASTRPPGACLPRGCSCCCARGPARPSSSPPA